MCVKDGKLLWSRLVSNDRVYQSRFSEKDGKISISWWAGRAGNSANHDTKTGRLLKMGGTYAPKGIEIGGK